VGSGLSGAVALRCDKRQVLGDLRFTIYDLVDCWIGGWDRPGTRFRNLDRSFANRMKFQFDDSAEFK
jgi:hypothetical protein